MPTKVRDKQTGEIGYIVNGQFVKEKTGLSSGKVTPTSTRPTENMGFFDKIAYGAFTTDAGSRYYDTAQRYNQKYKDIYNRATQPDTGEFSQNPVSTGVQAAGTSIGFFGDMAFDTLASLTPRKQRQKVNEIVEKAMSGKLGQGVNELAQQWEQFSEQHPETAATLSGVANIAGILPVGKGAIKAADIATGGAATAAKTAGKAASKELFTGTARNFRKVANLGFEGSLGLGRKAVGALPESAQAAIKSTGKAVGSIGRATTDVVGDVTPTRESLISSQLVKALDLNATDASKIKNATGNEVGEFLSSNELIGKNLDETQVKLEAFFEENYNAVREAIDSVDTVYPDPPAYRESLEAIKSTINDVPGLQKENQVVDDLLSKSEVRLADVQEAKELLDDYFQLYKVTGDEAFGSRKKGVRNLRKELRAFIEEEVAKSRPDIDIQDMNNKVATSKTILESAAKRAPRGFARQEFSLADWGALVGGGIAGGIATGGTGILAGAALVFAKKVMQSPAIRLRFAKWLASLPKAKRASFINALEAGSVPMKELPDDLKVVAKEAVDDTSGLTDDLGKSVKGLQASKRIISEDAYRKAKANLASKRSRLNSGIPIDEIPDMVVVASYHIENGIKTVAELSARLAKDGYELTREQVEKLFNKVSSNSSLMSEAKKYSSADEFIDSVFPGGVSLRERSQYIDIWRSATRPAKGDVALSQLVPVTKKQLKMTKEATEEVSGLDDDLGISAKNASNQLNQDQIQRRLSDLKTKAEEANKKFLGNRTRENFQEFQRIQKEISEINDQLIKRKEQGQIAKEIEYAKKLKEIDSDVDKMSQDDLSKLFEEAKNHKDFESFIGLVRGSATQYGEYKPHMRKFLFPESTRVSNIDGLDPNTEITVYRGLDVENMAGKRISNGDFVTTDYDDALAYTNSPRKVLSKNVKLKDLIAEYPDEVDTSDPNNIVSYELIYNKNGDFIKITDAKIREIWNRAHKK